MYVVVSPSLYQFQGGFKECGVDFTADIFAREIHQARDSKGEQQIYTVKILHQLPNSSIFLNICQNCIRKQIMYNKFFPLVGLLEYEWG